MLEDKILRSKEELGLMAKRVFLEAGDMDAYKLIRIKVDKDLKTFLEEIQMRDGIDKQFKIPGSSALNNLLIVRLEEIRPEGDDYECDLLVQFFAEKEDFKDLIELEEKIKGQVEGLSDLEKAKFLNRFISEKIAYDRDHRSRSALAAAITHKGTCTAFAQLFLILGEAAGLKVGCINSKIMKHRWNYVIIGDKTYYLDVTFNSSIRDKDKQFFQTSPIHVDMAPDQGIAVPHQE